ncbi:MAG TPA: hypothetical protein VKB53_13935 [Gammaproteobacteria bacterium]|nr:hypothetical protein [Gammaproteobacteria bacterium]
MPTVQEEWESYLVIAQASQPLTVVPIPIGPIAGRFLRQLVRHAVHLYAAHRGTIIVALTQVTIAALDALVAHVADFDNLNPPGPG